MGVTIHFEGKLKDEEAYKRVIESAENLAHENSWKTEIIDEKQVTLSRVKDEKDWDYTGPTKGIVLYPHENSEFFRLEFDRDLYVQEYIKTQFAPLEIHTKIISFLKSIQSKFESLKVNDEGEYWETGDTDILQGHLNSVFSALEDELRNNKNAQGPVLLDSGRIADIIS